MSTVDIGIFRGEVQPLTVSNTPASKWAPDQWLSCPLLGHQSVRHKILKLADISQFIAIKSSNLCWSYCLNPSYTTECNIFPFYNICNCIKFVATVYEPHYLIPCIQQDTFAESFIAVIGSVVYPVSLVLTDWLTGHSATKHAPFAICCWQHTRGVSSPPQIWDLILSVCRIPHRFSRLTARSYFTTRLNC